MTTPSNPDSSNEVIDVSGTDDEPPIVNGEVNKKILHYVALVAMYEPLYNIQNLRTIFQQADLTKMDPLLKKSLNLHYYIIILNLN